MSQQSIRQIAFYGKGGVGKSTTSSNVAAALAEMGYKVMVIGCDPKHDCTGNLHGGTEIPTVLDVLRDSDREKQSIDEMIAGKKIGLEKIVFEGYRNISCIEAGGPKPGHGCAGRGVILVIDLLRKNGIFEKLKPDVVIYDVLGDVVCGGFAMPLRMGLAEDVYVVSSADYMSLYAANNICKGIADLAKKGGTPLGGLIYNVRGTLDDPDTVAEYVNRIGSGLVGKVPNSHLIAEAEIEGKTVIEYAPDSEIAQLYREMARAIFENTKKTIPKPLEAFEMAELGQKIKEKIRALYWSKNAP
ncbi:MAG: nitrogenase iron protein [Methanoregula sp.]|jgi:nitrogenase iron protein NifH